MLLRQDIEVELRVYTGPCPAKGNILDKRDSQEAVNSHANKRGEIAHLVTAFGSGNHRPVAVGKVVAHYSADKIRHRHGEMRYLLRVSLDFGQGPSLQAFLPYRQEPYTGPGGDAGMELKITPRLHRFIPPLTFLLGENIPYRRNEIAGGRREFRQPDITKDVGHGTPGGATGERERGEKATVGLKRRRHR